MMLITRVFVVLFFVTDGKRISSALHTYPTRRAQMPHTRHGKVELMDTEMVSGHDTEEHIMADNVISAINWQVNTAPGINSFDNSTTDYRIKRHKYMIKKSKLPTKSLGSVMSQPVSLFTTELPFLNNNPWDYLNNEEHIDASLDYDDGHMLRAMISQLIRNSTCNQMGMNGSVMCCTFNIDNTSYLSTICTNETTHHSHTKAPREICPEYKWEPFLKIVCIPTLCAFGLIGNTISFFVMCSNAYRRKSYGYYLRALAVFDNLTLIISLVFTLNDVSYDMNRPNMTSTSNFSYTGFMSNHTTATCKLTEFLRHVVYLMSSWLVVCFTLDRFIAVCFPLLRVRYCTERSAIYTIVLLLAAVMLSQTYHLVFVQKLDGSLNLHVPCHAPNYPDPSIRLIYFGLNYFWFSFLLRFTIPFIAIALCNGFIIYHIVRMRKGRNLQQTRRKHKASLAIYTLYAVCACFVITVLPNAIISIFQFSAFFINEKTIDPDLYCTLKMVYTPFHVLRLVNYSANFVLYGLTGGKFRRELYKLLGCCIKMRYYDKRSIQSPEPIPLNRLV